jgi:WD40 repeat protein
MGEVDYANFSQEQYWKELYVARREQENITLCSCFSSDGNFLVAGSNFGFVNVWRINPPNVR